MKRACLLAALLAILLPVGCGKKDAGLSGTYEGRCVWNGIDSTMTFHDDGTFEGKSPTEVITGTYKLEGRKLSITVTEVNGEQPPQYPGTRSATATLSEDGRSISGEGGQWTKQE